MGTRVIQLNLFALLGELAGQPARSLACSGSSPLAARRNEVGSGELSFLESQFAIQNGNSWPAREKQTRATTASAKLETITPRFKSEVSGLCSKKGREQSCIGEAQWYMSDNQWEFNRRFQSKRFHFSRAGKLARKRQLMGAG